MKKFVSVLLIFVIAALSLSGCSFPREKAALVISGAEISREIYAYYLDKVESRPEDYGMGANHKEKEARDAAIELCKRYLALNTYFASLGLLLTPGEKVTIADNVNNFWMRSANHYKKIGVSRAALTRILTSDAYEDAIFTKLYDPGIADRKSEEKITEYFYQNFIAFRSIVAYFTSYDGSSRITGQQKQEILDSFAAIAAASGSTSDEFTDACSAAGYVASDILILDRASEGYPNGFFNRVYLMDGGTTAVMEYDDCVFAVRKEDLRELGEGLYASYRSVCINAMHTEDWNNELSNYMASLTVEEENIK